MSAYCMREMSNPAHLQLHDRSIPTQYSRRITVHNSFPFLGGQSTKMRLLDTKTLQLSDFPAAPPDYAILSHTWESEEFLFSDVGQKSAQKKRGAAKVLGACNKALHNGYNWIWIDTCCIDKSSSSELSEAINSMFKWYADAAVCFAYLVDVKTDFANPNDIQHLRKSRWFTRGWTLQEILAPRFVEFYDVNWFQLGTKLSLRSPISEITGIRETVLANKFDESTTSHISVAEKLSWASSRQTSRIEDIAYCLMGLFHINMP